MKLSFVLQSFVSKNKIKHSGRVFSFMAKIYVYMSFIIMAGNLLTQLWLILLCYISNP